MWSAANRSRPAAPSAARDSRADGRMRAAAAPACMTVGIE
ncbi:hypothetical protein C7S16_4396 [Burkholderia thailandensis]|uniref:Uncharacterized protein n=1 Tax=Burkholderia thailandensis TaxID=57975 RepID=A0AAW9CTN3_BURTH|nr:hypothetical protein [Burkholderia thailandensis]MDW9252019.1 hypothetical protein [Burkholderia thailandensis]